MKMFILIFIAVAGAAATSLAEADKMPAEVRKALQNSGKFHDIRKVADLPPGMVKLVTHGGEGMADPGEKWQVTDVIMDRTLPGRRLIWAASDGAYCIIHYETGGIAHLFHTTVVELEHGQTAAQVAWDYSGMPAKEFKNLPSFLEAVGVKSNR